MIYSTILLFNGLVIFSSGIEFHYNPSRYERSTANNNDGNVYFLVGQDVSLPCLRENTDEFTECSWTQQGGASYTKDELNLHKAQNITPYSGNEDCSILLKPEKNQTWTCKSTLKGKTEEQSTAYQLLEGSVISEPVITVEGRESPKLTVLADKNIYLNCITFGSPPATIEFSDNVPTSNHTISQNTITVKIKPTRKDNGKSLTCTAKQKIQEVFIKNSTVQLNVQFPPSCESSNFNSENNSLTLSFSCDINPPPKRSSFWTYAESFGDEPTQKIFQDKRFKVEELKKDESSGLYITTLFVNQPTAEDFQTCFYFTVENDLGEVTVKKCPEKSNNSVGVIAGILVAVGILIALLIAGILIYRKKMRSSYDRANIG